MASGDTKTQQYLDVAANGTRADLPAETCCETRTQSLIRGVAERIMDVEDEVERLENNPDVVDIVDTYADLQDYPTSGLTDKDVIRVITDETKGGLSSYYRWNSPNPGWNFIGVIPSGGIKELSSADYNYPTGNPDRVALWLLDNGLYTAPAGVMVAASTTSYPWYNTSDKTILVGGSDTVKGIYTFLNGKTDVVTTQVSDGTEADEYTLLKSTQVLQATGQSTIDTMSQKAITDAIAGGGGPTVVQTTGTSTTDVMSQNATTSMVFSANSHDYNKIGIDIEANGAFQSSSVRIGHGPVVYGDGISIGWGQSGNNNISSGNVTIRGAGGGASNYGARAQYGAIAIGNGNTDVRGDYSVAVGGSATVANNITYAIALGAGSKATMKGQMQIGLSDDSTNGYNNSQYRLLTGLYDPQSDHDAATKGYVDTAVASAGGAEEINSTDWSALWQ